MSDDPDDSSLKPTLKYEQPYDEVAIKRARELLTATPENVGPYRILERIGGGGMGDVYRAEQRSPIRRQVAIKFIKLGMDSKAVIIRFEAERQALALMDHPHIAKVFDAGTDDSGRPYFVMEYVKGKPITDYADQNHLTIAERLKLFEQVCQAVQHAHHKGVIHRDLKPGNVLVSTQDGEPFAKVIDFGVAKAISQKLTDGTLFTQHDQFIGTPQYMSPEQAEGSVDIDTRTDVYSLGVLLYELLTGSTPFSKNELKAAAFEQIKKMIIEVDPPKPSTRLGPNTPTLSSLATFRRTEPKRLGTLVQGELDWIVMKAIDKDRRRRYETPTSLANDIVAHLSGEPVQAAPPSTAYQIQKFVQRNRNLVIGAASVMTALLIGVFGTTVGLVRARIAEQNAIESKDEKEVALGLVTEQRDEKEKQRQLAEAATKAESKQREAAERHLVSGILRPIGFDNAFGAAELKSFSDWSALNDSRLQSFALQIAFEDPATALRAAHRAERVIQSCVGLSPERRAAAIEFVSIKQRDSDSDPRIRVAACWLALELGSADLPALEESMLYLSRSTHLPSDTFREFVELVVSRIDPSQQEVANRIGVKALMTIWENSSNKFRNISPAIWGLIELGRRSESTQDAKLVETVVPLTLKEILEPSDGFTTQREATRRLVSFASRLTPSQIEQVGDALIENIEQATDGFTISNSIEGLVSIAPHLGSTKIIRGVEALIAGLKKSTAQDGLSNWGDVLHSAIEGLVKLSRQLESTQIVRFGDALIAVLEKDTKQGSLEAAVEGLVAIVPQLEKSQISRSWDALIRVETKFGEGFDGVLAREGLNAVAQHLEPMDVIRNWDALIAILDKSIDLYALNAGGMGLAALAPHVEATKIEICGNSLINILERSTNGLARSAACGGLVALAPRLEPKQISRSWDTLISALEKSAGEDEHYSVDKGLVALAPRLKSTQLVAAANSLIEILERSTNATVLSDAAEGLVALAPRLELMHVSRGGDALIDVLKNKATCWLVISTAGKGLVTLASRMETAQVVRGANSLIAIIENSRNHSNISEAFEALVRLPPLEPAQFTRVCDALLSVLNESSDWRLNFSALQALASLAPRMESTQFARYVGGLIKILEQPSDSHVVSARDGLIKLVPRLEPSQVMRSWEALLKVLGYNTGMWSEPLATGNGLVALAMRMDVIVRERVVEHAVEMFCDVTATDESQSYQIRPIYGGFDIVNLISNPRSLAKLLSHPGCVGPLRQVMVLRFEELVLHGGQPVLSQVENQDGEPPTRGSVPQRQFHNLHDAGAWIEKNWPDFDLETNHPVTWRGDHK